jgi:hypothetical protein
MKYGVVLRDSFRFFRHNRPIWLCGILMALASLLNTMFGSIVTEYNKITTAQAQIAGSTPSTSVHVILLASFPFIWVIVLLASSLPRATLIGMLGRAEKGSNCDIHQGWQVAKTRYWQLFKISLLLTLPVMLMRWLTYFGTFFADRSNTLSQKPPNAIPQTDLPALYMLCCIAFFIFLAILMLVNIEALAARICLVEGLNVSQSTQRGWKLLHDNLGKILINTVVLSIISLPFGYLAIVPAYRLRTPLGQALIDHSWSGATSLQLVEFLLWIMIGFSVIYGMWNGFYETVWSRLYGVFVKRESEPAQETEPDLVEC